MNTAYFYMHLSEQLHTHIRILNHNNLPLEFFSNRNDLLDSFTMNEALISILCSDIREPTIININEMVSYISVPMEEKICLMGPLGLCDNASHRFTCTGIHINDDLVSKLYPATAKQMVHTAVLLFNMFAEKPLDEMVCLRNNCEIKGAQTAMMYAENRLFDLMEYGDSHNPIDLELREMRAIETGSVEQLKKCWNEDYSGRLGVLSDVPERNAKYLCIINIALSARAAIRGGIPFEMAFSLSDAYCRQIDEVNADRLEELGNLVRNAQITYTNLVARQRGINAPEAEESPLVTRAQNYIFSHLHGRLTVQEIANELVTHPNYLNRLFKKHTGMSIYKAITRSKINLAIDMLTYSDRSYIQIANYLGFTSQSHLIEVFKKQTGITPAQYRTAYGKVKS